MLLRPRNSRSKRLRTSPRTRALQSPQPRRMTPTASWYRGSPSRTEATHCPTSKIHALMLRFDRRLGPLLQRVANTGFACERFKERVLNALVAEKLALKEIAHEPENTSIAEPAAEPAAAPDPDDADGVLVDWVPAALVESTSTANNELPRHQLTWRSTGS